MGFRSYFDSSSSGGGGGTPGGVNGDLQYNNAGAFGGLTPGVGVTTLLAGTPSGTGGLAGTTSPTFTTGITVNGVLTQTSASATAFESGPNGGTNPVFRLVNSIASQSVGLSITGGISGAGVTVTAIGGGPNENINLTPKAAGYFVVSGNGLISNSIILKLSPSVSMNETAGNFHILCATNNKAVNIQSDVVYTSSGGAGTLLFGLGLSNPTYAFHVAPTAGITANQTMLIQDAGATGSTGIFFNAGASQSTNPVLTVQGSNSIQAAGTVKGTLTTLANAVTGLVAGALAALTNASLVLTDGTGTVYRIPCVTP